MTGAALARVTLIAVLAFVCFGCGGGTETKTTSPTTDSTETELGAKLTIPVGDYAGCTTTIVGVRPRSVGTGGGDGTVRLSAADDGSLSADVSFGQWLTGTMAFTATSSTTAGLSASPFEVEVLDTAIIPPVGAAAPSGSSVSVAAGTLVLSGDTLFISLYAYHGDTQLSAYSTCPVPTSLPSTTIANSASQMTDIPTGSYTACTASFGSETQSRTSGDDLTLSLAASNGKLTVTESAGVVSVCDLAFDYESGTTAMLSDRQTCMIYEPCGPPPSLGTSSAPDEATLTNMTGAIDIAGGALFINVVGDAPADACGSHLLSLICPPTQ
jgi:hypothetical protein